MFDKIKKKVLEMYYDWNILLIYLKMYSTQTDCSGPFTDK